MNAADNIALVGPMGAGKTTIGRHLAKILQRTFVDLDAEIEARCGAGIPWIFDCEGEQGFRDRETALLVELASRENLVVATGGGVVLRPQNRLALKEMGVVVFLSVTARELFERTRHDTHRPLLQVPISQIGVASTGCRIRARNIRSFRSARIRLNASQTLGDRLSQVRKYCGQLASRSNAALRVLSGYSAVNRAAPIPFNNTRRTLP